MRKFFLSPIIYIDNCSDITDNHSPDIILSDFPDMIFRSENIRSETGVPSLQ